MGAKAEVEAPEKNVEGRGMLEVVTMKEMEAIFAVTDAMGLSREAIEVPLSPEDPGDVRRLPSGKFEIVVPASTPLDAWATTLEEKLRAAGA
ncbi:MAG: hypothetical protein HYY96_07415 [Candidatus Tectomicrobia bacterium]|nr:hypothetical protein [Candidatus Tectomicrobia bacterium]